MPTEQASLQSRWARHAGIFNIVARLSGAGLAFLLTIMLARTMEPSGFAQVSVMLAWLAVATALGGLSMPLVVVRFVGDYVAQGRPDLARGVLLFLYFVRWRPRALSQRQRGQHCIPAGCPCRRRQRCS